MKVRKATQKEICKFYSRQLIAQTDDGLRVGRLGTHSGVNGSPAIRFVLPHGMLPVSENGAAIDITKGLKCEKGFIAGYNMQPYVELSENDVRVILGKRCFQNPDIKAKIDWQFDVTYDPAEAQVVMFICHYTEETSCNTELFCQLWKHPIWKYSTKPYTATSHSSNSPDFMCCYVLDFSYNSGGLSTSEIAALTQARRQMLTRIYGEVEVLAPLTEYTGLAHNNKSRVFQAWHYEDDMAHEQAFVINREGRLLTGTYSPNDSEAASFTGATVARLETWVDPSPDWLILQYVRQAFSQPAVCKIIQQPSTVDIRQSDRVLILEHNILEGHRRLIKDFTEVGLTFVAPLQLWSVQLANQTIQPDPAVRAAILGESAEKLKTTD